MDEKQARKVAISGTSTGLTERQYSYFYDSVKCVHIFVINFILYKIFISCYYMFVLCFILNIALNS